MITSGIKEMYDLHKPHINSSTHENAGKINPYRETAALSETIIETMPY